MIGMPLPKNPIKIGPRDDRPDGFRLSVEEVENGYIINSNHDYVTGYIGDRHVARTSAKLRKTLREIAEAHIDRIVANLTNENATKEEADQS